jgi:MoxR-like ATPase
VVATQNPIELEGTFPLPEAQLDRFLLTIRLGYPSEEDEKTILLRFAGGDPLPSLTAVADAGAIAGWQRSRGAVQVEDDLRDYLLHLVRATRCHADIELGASPRAGLALYRACQALALLEGRDYVIPDDVKLLIEPVLAHRIIPSSAARLRGSTAASVLAEICGHTEVPVEAE